MPLRRPAFRRRFQHTLDGVPDLLSYLVFNSLARHAPTLARRLDELGRLWRGRVWLVGRAETEHGPLDIAYRGSPDRMSRWLLERLGAKSVCIATAAPALGRQRSGVEIALIRAAEARDRARAGWLILPRYVHHRQVLGGPLSAFEQRVSRRVEEKGISVRFSRDAADLERFQRELYDPMLKRRHGDRALRTGRALLRFGQGRGGLMLAEIASRWIAGAVGAPSAQASRELEIWTLGVAADAPAGAGLAPVLGWVRWARESGFVAVDHLVSLPLYSDGLTRQKLRWGTILSEPAECHELLALRVHGSGSALRTWLGRHTFAVRSNAGIVPLHVDDPVCIADAARELGGH